MMFNKNDNSELIITLKNRISELEKQLNLIANDNGSIIVKQLPNGKIELNGIEMDNTNEVEYYNSANATYGELTMFRIGKEAKQREMDKLIKRHMDECDKYVSEIDKLKLDIFNLEQTHTYDNDTINILHENENKLNKIIEELNVTIENNKSEAEFNLRNIINRYEQLINGLEEDISHWKERYLKINNITTDGTIITKYGKVLGK